MQNKIKVGIIGVASILLLTGCEGVPEREFDDEAVLQPTYNEELEEIHEIVREKELDDFTLVTRYNTIDYDINKWRIIDNKTILIEAWTEGLPNEWEAIIEHVHIDMFVTPDKINRPTILQDQMDDKFHGYSQDGFVINDNISYQNIFSVIGVDETITNAIDPWYSLEKSYPQHKVKEDHFRIESYNQNTMQIVYDVMIKKPGSDYYETIAVYDEIVIPAYRGGED